MVGLLDIAKVSKTVQVRGTDVPITGIKLQQFVDLLAKHIDIGAAIGGSNFQTGMNLVKLGPKVLGAVIATGIGFPDDDKQTQAAADLLPGEQLDLILAICEVSLSGDIRPFAEKLNRLGIVDAVKQSFRSLGTGSGTASPSTSPMSSRSAATPPKPSGPTPPVSSPPMSS